MPPEEHGAPYIGEGARAVSQLLCRVRPCDKPSPFVTVIEEEARIQVGPDRGKPGEPLSFDGVFSSSSAGAQEELFEGLRPSVLACLRGASCTVVAFGGTQSGKSYSLSGFFTHGQLHGIAPRAIQLLVEALGADASSSPVLEASFFEVQQGSVHDLLPAGYPQVSLQELAEPPYCTLDSNLSVHRCDGAGGFNRLLDTYFTGLEHRRKGMHTCFQIAFLHPSGGQSYLRFVEMAWPRGSQAFPKPGGAVGSSGGGSGALPDSSASPEAAKREPAQGAAVAVLEEVLHRKLKGGTHAAVDYSGSPLAVLLKPCFEGASLLFFVHCLRLEHTQLPCLALAAPLLTKLHLWLGMTREMDARRGRAWGLAAPTVVPAAPGAGGGFGGGRAADSTGGIHSAPSTMPREGLADDCSNVSDGGTRQAHPSDGGGSGGRESGVGGAAGASVVVEAGPWAAAAAARAAAVVAAAAAAPGPGGKDAGGEHDAAGHGGSGEVLTQESWIVHCCGALLEARRRSFEALRADASLSSAALRDLDTLLGQLVMRREASGSNDGPDEFETNVKLLCDRVNRSLQRMSGDLRHLQQDIETLTHCCNGGSVPPLYDAFNVKEEDVQRLVDYRHQQHHATQEDSRAVPAQHQPPGQHQAPHQLGAPQLQVVQCRPSLAGTSKSREAVVVPQLPLSMLPQEHPLLPPNPMSIEDTLSATMSSCSSYALGASVGSSAAAPGGLTGGRSGNYGSGFAVRPLRPRAASPPKVPVPQLPLSLLPQEHPEYAMPQLDMTEGTTERTASSCSTDRLDGRGGCTSGMQRPPARRAAGGAARLALGTCPEVLAAGASTSVAAPGRCGVSPPRAAQRPSLPQHGGPPPTTLAPQPSASVAGLEGKPCALSSSAPAFTPPLPPPGAQLMAPQACTPQYPTWWPGAGGGGATPMCPPQAQAPPGWASRPRAVSPQPAMGGEAAAAVALAVASAAGSSMSVSAAPAPMGFRKSHSTASLRTMPGRPPMGVGHPLMVQAPPPPHGSPLVGHRHATSPTRCVSPPPPHRMTSGGSSCGASVAVSAVALAPPRGGGAASPAMAMSGACSPPMPPGGVPGAGAPRHQRPCSVAANAGVSGGPLPSSPPPPMGRTISGAVGRLSSASAHALATTAAPPGGSAYGCSGMSPVLPSRNVPSQGPRMANSTSKERPRFAAGAARMGSPLRASVGGATTPAVPPLLGGGRSPTPLKTPASAAHAAAAAAVAAAAGGRMSQQQQHQQVIGVPRPSAASPPRSAWPSASP